MYVSEHLGKLKTCARGEAHIYFHIQKFMQCHSTFSWFIELLIGKEICCGNDFYKIITFNRKTLNEYSVCSLTLLNVNVNFTKQAGKGGSVLYISGKNSRLQMDTCLTGVGSSVSELCNTPARTKEMTGQGLERRGVKERMKTSEISLFFTRFFSV